MVLAFDSHSSLAHHHDDAAAKIFIKSFPFCTGSIWKMVTSETNFNAMVQVSVRFSSFPLNCLIFTFRICTKQASALEKDG
jgi:hypothetical protein